MTLQTTTMVILIIFYLVLLIKWQYVRQPNFFLLGCAAIVLNILFAGILSLFSGRWAMVLIMLLSMVLTIAAFGCAILACYQAKLPVSIPGAKLDAGSENDSQD